jgi:hypothetical protein
VRALQQLTGTRGTPPEPAAILTPVCVVNPILAASSPVFDKRWTG